MLGNRDAGCKVCNYHPVHLDSRGFFSVKRKPFFGGSVIGATVWHSTNSDNCSLQSEIIPEELSSRSWISTVTCIVTTSSYNDHEDKMFTVHLYNRRVCHRTCDHTVIITVIPGYYSEYFFLGVFKMTNIY